MTPEGVDGFQFDASAKSGTEASSFEIPRYFPVRPISAWQHDSLLSNQEASFQTMKFIRLILVLNYLKLKSTGTVQWMHLHLVHTGWIWIDMDEVFMFAIGTTQLPTHVGGASTGCHAVHHSSCLFMLQRYLRITERQLFFLDVNQVGTTMMWPWVYRITNKCAHFSVVPVFKL